MSAPNIFNSENSPIVSVEAVSKRFGKKEDWIGRAARKISGGEKPGVVNALNGVSIQVKKGEIFGIAGESGCGKSTLGRLMAGLSTPSDGVVLYKGQPVIEHGKPRNLKLQMIFQDSGSALNPRMTVLDLIGEGPVLHGLVPRKQVKDFVVEQLELVGLNSDALARFPHQFSGGQRQRVNIARALALQPDTLICDESIAALDVSIQAQILNLFMDLKDKLDLTYVFISHDLSVLKHICDRIAVMYLGRVVETGDASQVFGAPKHPYTQVLIDNVPELDRRGQIFQPAVGEVPSPINIPSGCAFHTRCVLQQGSCKLSVPSLIGPDEHQFACPVVRERELNHA